MECPPVSAQRDNYYISKESANLEILNSLFARYAKVNSMKKLLVQILFIFIIFYLDISVS